MKRYFRFLIIACLSTVAFSSCQMSKNIPYFKGLESSNEENGVIQNEAVIHNDDMLSISVSTIDPVAVAPFNLPFVAYMSPGSETLSTTPVLQPYLVDVNGEISFPVIGKIKVAGLKKSDAEDLIKQKLEPYLKDPIVLIQFRNYKITVLGEVSRPGTYTISNERISILEALGLAGDLTIYGKRDNVLLIRETEGGRKEYVRINLNDTNILSSTFFYLQQNDVIYVEPNKTKITSASAANVGLYLSTVNALASAATVIVSVISLNRTMGK